MNIYTPCTGEKQEMLSDFTAYYSNQIYVNDDTPVRIAYECNDGKVSTIVCEFVRNDKEVLK